MAKKKRLKGGKSPQKARKKSQAGSGHASPPDRRALEAITRQIFGGVADNGDPLDSAQQLMYEAFDAESPRRQIELARRALQISSDCADAYVLLAGYASSLEEATSLYEQGVAAGARALGEKGFREYQGHFWGFLPTRPYMRARAGLADALWAAGKREESVSHYQALLELNPNDNQGIRYRLASALLDLQRHEELSELLQQYAEDGMADWTYTRALLTFRQEGDSENARQKLREAYESNSYVPAYLTGAAQLPRELPAYISPGREDEAIGHAAQFLPAWKNTPGAISWLRNTLDLKVAESPRPKAPSWRKLKPMLSALPQNDDVWEIELQAIDNPEGGKCWGLGITSTLSNKVLLLEPLESRPTDNKVLEQLWRTMLQPEVAEPGRPRAVRVKRKTWHRLWQSKLSQLDIDCELVDALPKLEALMADIGAQAEMMVRFGVSLDDEGQLEDLSSLPQNAGEVWQADIRQLKAWVSIEGQPQRPWMLIVANRTEQLIYATDMRETPPADWLRHGVLKAISQPAVGPAHRPGIIEVASEEKLAEIGAELEPHGIHCVVAERLDLLDEMVADLTDHLAGSSGPKALVDSPGITPDVLGDFFRAAADFYRRKPWRSIAGDTIIQVECEAFQSGPWFAIVMGQSGMSLGLALYEDLELLQDTIAGSLSDEENSRRTSALSVTYSEAFEFAAKDLAAVEEHGWPIAGPEAYPMVMRVNPGWAVRAPLKWELALLTACLDCLPQYLEEHPDGAPAAVSSPGSQLTLRLSMIEEF